MPAASSRRGRARMRLAADLRGRRFSVARCFVPVARHRLRMRFGTLGARTRMDRTPDHRLGGPGHFDFNPGLVEGALSVIHSLCLMGTFRVCADPSVKIPQKGKALLALLAIAALDGDGMTR